MKLFQLMEFNTFPICQLLLEHFPIRKLIFELHLKNLSLVFKRTLQNYAKWQLLNSKLKLFAAVTEGLSSSSNDFFCLAIVNELMPIALGRVFAEYILPTNTKVSNC